MPPSPPRALRNRTRDELFDLICAEDLTRSEIAARLGLSQSTVNEAVGRLLRAGRVVEVAAVPGGAGSGSGRPAVRLRAQAGPSSVAGIDFGHNHVAVAVGDSLGRIVGMADTELDVDLHAEGALDAAAALLAQLRTEHGLDTPAAVVAGIPGPLELQRGLVRSPTILSGWVELAPAEELGRRLGQPVLVENDAVLGALGELRQGAGLRQDNFLYVKASHGVGAALVIGGELYRGSTGLAGEIGHITLPGHSQMCRYGNRGCLEAIVSVPMIRDQIAHTRPGVDPRQIRITSEHDSLAGRILNDAGFTLGAVLSVFCNLLNPQKVIIGGELGASGPDLVDGVTAAVRRHALPAIADGLEICPAALGVRAELIGAVQLAAMSAA